MQNPRGSTDWEALSLRVVFAALTAILLLVLGFFRGAVLIAQGEVWAAWLVLGGIFVLLGMVAWSKRSPRSSE